MLKSLFKKVVPKFSYLYYFALGIKNTWVNLSFLPGYKREYKQFLKLASNSNQRFELSFKNALPCLTDKTTLTPFDSHYIYHPAWAARILVKIKPEFHIDISSTLHFCSIISAFIPVRFYDYRPAVLNLDNLSSEKGDLTNLPFENDSVSSISCMHTIEHIGLGRYGDPLDYDGDIKAINELLRVTKPGGNILFVTPVGKPRIMFNGHRIYSFEQIKTYFNNCELLDFSLISDAAEMINNANPALVREQVYGCGCFWFKKN